MIDMAYIREKSRREGKIMKKTYIALLAGALSLAGVMSNAEAHDSVGFSINLGGPAYYVAPPPVYYAPPPVVYYRPAPVYYGPSAYFRYDDEPRYREHHDNGFHRGWHKNTRYDDDD